MSLNDRDYMRDSQNSFGNTPQTSSSIGAVKLLIALNVIVFILQMMNKNLINDYALIGSRVSQNGEYYRLITCMFLHGGLWHLLFNMWGLFLFGSLLETKIGKTHFLVMYFLSGLIGSGFWMLTNGNSPFLCVGASGALFGVIACTPLFFPNIQIMLLFPPIPMKLKTFAVVYLVLEVFMKMSGGTLGGNIAHIVHIGGAVGGYIYIRILFSREIVWDFFPLNKKKSPYKPPKGWSTVKSKENNYTGPVTQDELDDLLDKISSQGINSLNDDEMQKLRNAREQMRQ